MPGTSLVQLLTQFARGARLDGTYFFCNQDQLLTAAKLLGRVAGLSLEDRYTFCLAPAPLSDERAVTALLQFARTYAASKVSGTWMGLVARIGSGLAAGPWMQGCRTLKMPPCLQCCACSAVHGCCVHALHSLG